jgi:HK97 family phage prohead protease
MKEQIQKGNVVLAPAHKSDWSEELGRVVDAEITKDNELKVKCELDMREPKAQKLWNALESGKQLGLSIGGDVKKSFLQFSKQLGKFVKVIEDVVLEHIAVTSRPANPRTWISAMAKSLDKEVTSIMSKMTVEQALAALEEAMQEKDEAEKTKKLTAAKSELIGALKAKKVAEGKAEDVAAKEAETEAAAEVEKRIKTAKDEEKKGDEKPELVSISVTKEQAERIKELLKSDEERKVSEQEKTIKELKETVGTLVKTIETLKTAPVIRKSMTLKSGDGDGQGGNLKKVLESEDYKKLSKSDQIRMMDDAVRKDLAETLGVSK